MSATHAATADTRAVSLTISRDASLVRTVRLVAASLARRSGLDAAAVEEVRLVVGETCAVLLGGAGLTQDGATPGERGDGADDVTVVLTTGDGLSAEIRGRLSPQEDFQGDLAELEIEPWALVRGLREDLAVLEEGDETVVRVAWSR